MVGFIGKEVVISGEQLHLKNGGPCDIEFILSGTAKTLNIEIRNADGKVVRTIKEDGHKEPGRHSIGWDGLDNNGRSLPDGDYTVNIDAKGSEDSTIGVEAVMKGIVTGITFENGYPELILGENDKVALGDVREIHQ